MSQVTNALGAGSATASTGSNAFNDIDLDVFLELMITELQNQDPLNPLENDQLLAQISQIREVGATDKLTSTLDAVLLGQNVSSATNLIGADVTALTDGGQRVTGNVRRVTIKDGQPLLDIAVDLQTKAGASDGDMEKGAYVYDIVWRGTDDNLYGIQVDANTGNFSDFKGSLEIHNLPDSPTDKEIYRTDKSGQGEARYIGSLRGGEGGAVSFIDQTSDAERQTRTLDETPIPVPFARKATVSLNNIAEINPPQ